MGRPASPLNHTWERGCRSACGLSLRQCCLPAQRLPAPQTTAHGGRRQSAWRIRRRRHGEPRAFPQHPRHTYSGTIGVARAHARGTPATSRYVTVRPRVPLGGSIALPEAPSHTYARVPHLQSPLVTLRSRVPLGGSIALPKAPSHTYARVPRSQSPLVTLWPGNDSV